MSSQNFHAQLIQRAAAAFQRGAWNEAADLCGQVNSQFGEDANALMMLGAISVEGGDHAAGIACLERARELMPAHIHVLVNLGVAYWTAGRLDAARDALENALRVDRRFALAHNTLGNVLLDIGDRAAARKSYERALVVQPNHAEAIAGLARIAEEEHRLDDARRLSEKALALAPQHAPARLTRARVALRDGDPATAVTLLGDLLRDNSLTTTNRVLAEGCLAESYDKLGRFGEAFAAFSRANELQYAQYLPIYANDRGPMSPAMVARLTGLMRRVDVSTWRDAPPVSGPAHVFLIGFPRSGTTLLDQVLASHPRVTALEERDALMRAAQELTDTDPGFERWAALPDSDIERLRALYWQDVATGLADVPIKDVFVDKLPLNAVHLPLIHRLFPGAKIILALRDPRDVLLSCFQQRFGMNPAMFQLLRMDSAAAYYDAVMALVAASRDALPLDVHPIKYESVVADFDATVAALLGFLGLDWSDAVRDYASTAKKRTIGTPSAAQVVQPIYTSAQGKWRNYRASIEPQLPTLEKWVQAFGYPPS